MEKHSSAASPMRAPKGRGVAQRQGNASPATLARKISDYCRTRVAQQIPPSDAEKLRVYLVGLISARLAPPREGKCYSWGEISRSSEIPSEILVPNREIISRVLDTIAREMPTMPAIPSRQSKAGPKILPKEPVSSRRAEGEPLCLKKKRRSTPRTPFPEPSPGVEIMPAPARRARGRRPLPTVFNPQPRWAIASEPEAFREALRVQMRRHGDTPTSLYRALTANGFQLGEWTIDFWCRGRRAPRATKSFAILTAIEQRYRLAEGYFAIRLPNRNLASVGSEIADIARSETRRLAWHLPNDFNERPAEEREQILQWVRTHVVSGGTEYRRFQAAAMKTRYALRFEGLFQSRRPVSAEESENPPIDDPELACCDRTAPAPLVDEMSRLLKFKMSTLAPLGLIRNGVWGDETAAQKLEHLALMFGGLVAAPGGVVCGLGVPMRSLTLALLVFPSVWDWYVQWRERRRGFYTVWEVNMLSLGASLLRSETGWLRQSRDIADALRPISGLVSDADILMAQGDWDGACDTAYKHNLARMKEIDRVARVHRDPFEAILPILEADSPLGEYRKIADEIRDRIPDEERHPRAAAEAVRAFLMIRLGLHLGVRQKNLRQLLVRRKDEAHSTERSLVDRRCGEVRWSVRDEGWEVVIPAVAFKNADSSYFGGKPFRLLLPDLGGLYEAIDAYVGRHRRALLQGAADPGTFFVKTVKITSKSAAYDQTTFYEAWRLNIQRYGIYNPYTGRGAIKGLLPHGPHNIRDILATHILKMTGSFEQASYAIQDTPATVAKHYARFLPQDKAALAAQVLNRVWEAA